MNRAQRRHDRFRVREKAKRILRWVMGDLFDSDSATKRAEHMASCSCSMCGNPRKFFGEKTRQESVDAPPANLLDES